MGTFASARRYCPLGRYVIYNEDNCNRVEEYYENYYIP